MRICCISDIHGHLPTIEPCDMLLIAGDICGHKLMPIFGRGMGYSPGSFADMAYQAVWLGTEFRTWLDAVPAKDVVATPGNHDFVFERARHLVPNDLRWHLLIDNVKVVQDKKIYASPYQHHYGGWAYNAPERHNGGEEFLDRKFSMIPNDADIIMVHGPPYGYGDMAPRKDDEGRILYWENTGSTSLTAAIMRVKPDVSLHGHIHMSRGQWEMVRGNCSPTYIVNAAICDEGNKPHREPIYLDI